MKNEDADNRWVKVMILLLTFFAVGTVLRNNRMDADISAIKEQLNAKDHHAP